MEIILAVGLVVCGVLWYSYRGFLREQQEAGRKWKAESILTEAEGVVMDFLDYGREISMATKGKYRGMISVRIHRIYKSGEMGFSITMYDSGNLAFLDERVRSEYHLESFVKKYGYYYDDEREAIVYISSQGVKLLPEERAELEASLRKRIQNHPLALMKPDGVISTRGI